MAERTADLIRRIFTATLIIGVPGSGKTSLFAPFAQYLWETYRKVLFLYSWDGGAIPTEVQRLMKQGLIRFWRVRTRSAEGLGLENLYLATKGYVPAHINAETGETSPAVDLVAPVTVEYTVRCPEQHLLTMLPARQLLLPTFCDTCRALIPVNELKVTEKAERTKGLELIGGVGFDGLTSMTGVVLEHMDTARGQGLIGGEKSSFGGVVVSGSIKLGGNNRADVGFAQSRGLQFVNNALSIPYLVEGPVFTALAMEATDEGGLAIVGPKLPGRAATDEATAWFGNVAECGKTADDQGQQHFTLFLRPFVDAQNRRHLLKTSASPNGLPDKLIDPIDQPWSQANLGLVFQMLDEDLRQRLKEEIPGAPGLAGTPTEYGTPLKMGAASAVSSTAAPAVNPSAIPPLTPPTPFAAPPMAIPVSGNAGEPPTAIPRARRKAAAEPTSDASSAAVPPAPAPPGMKPPQRAPGPDERRPS